MPDTFAAKPCNNFMSTTKVTNQRLVTFVNYARGFLHRNKEQSKWRYALERMDKRLKGKIEEYTEALNDIQIEHAATENEGGPVLTDAQGNFRYTKDGLRGKTKAQKVAEKKAYDAEYRV